jgi:hypothetical protein
MVGHRRRLHALVIPVIVSVALLAQAPPAIQRSTPVDQKRANELARAAIIDDDLDALRRALNDGADPNGFTDEHLLLWHAISHGNVITVRELIKAGADVRRIDPTGNDDLSVRMLTFAAAGPRGSSEPCSRLALTRTNGPRRAE